MKKIAIVIKASNPDAVILASNIVEWLAEKGVDAIGTEDLSGKVKGIGVTAPADIAREAEAVVVLGGDGMMLNAVRLMGGADVPVLGVNMGGLGFMTAVNPGEVFTNLKALLADDFETEERMMLEVEVKLGGARTESHLVLNDAVIKSRIARLCVLKTTINREYVTNYRSDGLIISTPTGSTAYSLSAGGPILYPSIHSIIVAPICPFNLTNRPVVVPDWMEVEAEVVSIDSDIMLTLDGQVDMALSSGDVVSARRAKQSVKLVKGSSKGYFDILRERLMWEVCPTEK